MLQLSDIPDWSADVKMCMKLKRSKYIPFNNVLPVVPHPTSLLKLGKYNTQCWLSTLSTSTLHRLNTCSKYVSVRLLSMLIYMWMWRWFQENQPLIKMQNLGARCGSWLRLSTMLQGFFVYCIRPIVLNYVTFPKLYGYLGILRRDSSSRNLPLEKLNGLHKPWLLVSSRIHILGFLLLFPRQPGSPRALAFVFPD